MARVMGFAGWSGAGKTTLLKRLIPELLARGYQVSTLKHAHHKFDIDRPGKDSYEHRQAGATEVMIVSDSRWALMHELRGQPEPGLPELLPKFSATDFILVEGFKRDGHAKIEIHRQHNQKPWMFPDDPSICALATDISPPATTLPQAGLDDIAAIADLVERYAVPMEATLQSLKAPLL